MKTRVKYLDENELIWDAPSKTQSQLAIETKERWMRVAVALRERPNQWAIIGLRDDGGAVNAAKAAEYLGDKYELTMRKIGGQSRLYARYRSDEEGQDV